jgi:quercetin dioxygenase-like cupin family protein
MPDLAGYVAGPGEGVAGDGADVKATATTTAGALTVMESVIRQGPPRHVHTHEDECFYVLDGTVAVTCGDEAFEAGPRSFVFLPRGLAHAFHAAEGEARVLMIAVPGGIEHYCGEINNAASTAEQERIGAKYGIRVVLALPAATGGGPARIGVRSWPGPGARRAGGGQVRRAGSPARGPRRVHRLPDLAPRHHGRDGRRLIRTNICYILSDLHFFY